MNEIHITSIRGISASCLSIINESALIYIIIQRKYYVIVYLSYTLGPQLKLLVITSISYMCGDLLNNDPILSIRPNIQLSGGRVPVSLI